jgi:hypothetical protein
MFMYPQPSPTELIEYLREPGRKKARKRFANNVGGRCCLGHYADMCGLVYRPEKGTFSVVDLPKGHWIFGVQERLALVNDTSPGFEKAIRILECVEVK